MIFYSYEREVYEIIIALVIETRPRECLVLDERPGDWMMSRAGARHGGVFKRAARGSYDALCPSEL